MVNLNKIAWDNWAKESELKRDISPKTCHDSKKTIRGTVNMSDNKNALEPLADSLANSINVIGTVVVQASTNILLFSVKGISELVKLIVDVGAIGYQCATGTYEYEAAATDEREKLRSVTDIEYKKVDYEYKPIEVEYLEIDDDLMGYSLPKLAKFKSNNKDTSNTLKAYVGVGELKQQQVIDFYKDGSLMIGGMSRWGKTSLILSICTSLMDRYDSRELRIVLVDFKMVDLYRLDCYKHIKEECINTIERFNDLMEGIRNQINKRTELFRELEVSNIVEYNEKSDKKLRPMVIVVDEIARIINHPSVDKKKMQTKISELVSVSMAFGIYWVIASQELSKETLGKMKVNFGQSVGLKCQSKDDSDLIMTNGELENLNDKGRCRIKNSEGIKEFQSYYLEIDEIREILKDKRK